MYRASGREMLRSSKGKAMKGEQEKFLQALLPAVLRLRDRTGLPASVVLAQAILESGWGLSRRS